jgi:hypothetical protein
MKVVSAERVWVLYDVNEIHLCPAAPICDVHHVDSDAWLVTWLILAKIQTVIDANADQFDSAARTEARGCPPFFEGALFERREVDDVEIEEAVEARLAPPVQYLVIFMCL